MISVLILAGSDLMLLLSFVAEKKRRLRKKSICGVALHPRPVKFSLRETPKPI